MELAEVKQRLDFTEEDECDPVQVFLRLKPLSDSKTRSSVTKESEKMVQAIAPKASQTFKSEARLGCSSDHRFTFSTVFAPESMQKTVFDASSLPALCQLIRGENALLFTYGVTNSGKTFTIQGTSKEPGLLPRSFDVLFNTIGSQRPTDDCRRLLKPINFAQFEASDAAAEERVFEELTAFLNKKSDLSLQSTLQTTQSSTESMTTLLERSARDSTSLNIESNATFSVWISYAEIYNGNVYDLLEAPHLSKKRLRRKRLTVGRDIDGNTFVRNLKSVYVKNSDEAIKVLMVGQRNQCLAATYLNQQSSRSHCVCTISVVRTAHQKQPHVSRMSFVDLAGSERTGKLLKDQDKARVQEASNINKSLMTLRKCLMALRWNQRHPDKPKVVSYRDSKLTEVLKNYFANPSLVSMMVNVSQDEGVFDETLQVLKFSALAQEVPVGGGWALKTPLKTPWKTPLRQENVTQSVMDASLCSCPEEDSYFADLEDDNQELTVQNAELCETVSKLRKQIQILEGNLSNQDASLRSELCGEFHTEMTEMMKTSRERIDEERSLGEKAALERLALQQQYFDVQLKAKEDQIDELENEIADLEGELGDMESEREKLTGKEDKKMADLYKELAEREKRADEKAKEVMKSLEEEKKKIALKLESAGTLEAKVAKQEKKANERAKEVTKSLEEREKRVEGREKEVGLKLEELREEKEKIAAKDEEVADARVKKMVEDLKEREKGVEEREKTVTLKLEEFKEKERKMADHDKEFEMAVEKKLAELEKDSDGKLKVMMKELEEREKGLKEREDAVDLKCEELAEKEKYLENAEKEIMDKQVVHFEEEVNLSEMAEEDENSEKEIGRKQSRIRKGGEVPANPLVRTCFVQVPKLPIRQSVNTMETSLVVNELEVSRHTEVDVTPRVASKKVKGKKRGRRAQDATSSPKKLKETPVEETETQEVMSDVKELKKKRGLLRFLSPRSSKKADPGSAEKKESPEKRPPRKKKLFTKDQISSPLSLFQQDDERPVSRVQASGYKLRSQAK
eukprot:m.17326 g.17326  ORF g.17326 m.17326 type:complete len:1028 (+) comp27442_c0_seq2:41-3124(+)